MSGSRTGFARSSRHVVRCPQRLVLALRAAELKPIACRSPTSHSTLLGGRIQQRAPSLRRTMAPCSCRRMVARLQGFLTGTRTCRDYPTEARRARRRLRRPLGGAKVLGTGRLVDQQAFPHHRHRSENAPLILACPLIQRGSGPSQGLFGLERHFVSSPASRQHRRQPLLRHCPRRCRLVHHPPAC